MFTVVKVNRRGSTRVGCLLTLLKVLIRQRMLHPLCYYLVIIKCLKNRFVHRNNLIHFSYLFMFLGQVFRTCYSWGYISIFHCFLVTALAQNLLEWELCQPAVLHLCLPDNSLVFDIQFWFHRCETQNLLTATLSLTAVSVCILQFNLPRADFSFFQQPFDICESSSDVEDSNPTGDLF